MNNEKYYSLSIVNKAFAATKTALDCNLLKYVGRRFCNVRIIKAFIIGKFRI